MTPLIVGPPPGWAGDAYGAQSTPTGWRGWLIRDREVTWLPPTYYDLENAIEDAREAYQQLESGSLA